MHAMMLGVLGCALDVRTCSQIDSQMVSFSENREENCTSSDTLGASTTTS